MMTLINMTQAEIESLVEEKVCKPIDKLKQYPLTDDQSDFLVKVLLSYLSGGGINVDAEFQEVLNTDMRYQMIHNRFKSYNLKCRIDFELLCYYIFRSPGEVSIMAAYIAHKVKTLNVTSELTSTDWCDIFMMGYYNSDDLLKVWDNQKINPSEIGGMMDNALDYTQFNKSIILTK